MYAELRGSISRWELHRDQALRVNEESIVVCGKEFKYAISTLEAGGWRLEAEGQS